MNTLLGHMEGCISVCMGGHRELYSYMGENSDCTTEALEIKGTTSRVCTLRLLVRNVWMTQHSIHVLSHRLAYLISRASVVQTGYITPTRRFSDTLLVAAPLCSVYPLNRCNVTYIKKHKMRQGYILRACDRERGGCVSLGLIRNSCY